MQVEAKGVGKTFDNHTVLADFSAVFPKGRVVALTGPSGSGKTTLLSLIAGLTKPDSGTIVIRELDGRTSLPSQRRVAWVPQGSNCLPSRTAIDNVLIGALARGIPFSEAAEASLSALRQVGLEQVRDQRAGSLSGGELQRVCLARAIAAGRDIILADEPSSNLDLRNTQILGRVVADLTVAAFVIIATHDPLLIEAADVVIDVRSAIESNGE